MSFTHRLATRRDLHALRPLVDAAIEELQRPFLDDAQIAASRALMGVDTRLVDDGTYFVVEWDGLLAGCGGWSRRAALFGGDHIAGRDESLLDPRVDAARVRAMYTHPAFARRGVGRRILDRCEEAARAEGFRRLELVASLAGEPLYRAVGFVPVRPFTDTSTGTPIPLVAMEKAIDDDTPERAGVSRVPTGTGSRPR
jgi:GNAT superfamily N-acetyltransferase